MARDSFCFLHYIIFPCGSKIESIVSVLCLYLGFVLFDSDNNLVTLVFTVATFYLAFVMTGGQWTL